MGIFDGVTGQQVKDAQVYSRGAFLNPGVYDVVVTRVLEANMRPPKNTGMFIVEMDILETSNPKHVVGSKATWMATADKDAFLSNVKGFISVAGGGINFEELSNDEAKATLKDAVSEDNPLASVRLRVNVTMVKTQAGKDFSRHDWTLLPGW